MARPPKRKRRPGRHQPARRAAAIAAYQATAARAQAQGEGARASILDHLRAYSAAEIENAEWTLRRTLDRLPAQSAARP